MMTSILSTLPLTSDYTDNLPADSDTRSDPRYVFNAAYSWAQPKKCSQPKLISLSHDTASILGFDPNQINTAEFAEVFCGNSPLPGMRPYANCYGGHQFGRWAGQLGDGRAINLGQVITPSHGLQTLQLKGAGPTPYSRTADGLAVLRSSIREFLCSEAMHHLGIPTTRALSLCLTGDQVVRDMFYDGRPKAEPGAIVCRVSSSFTRFGSLQLPASRGDITLLKAQVDHTLRCDYPELGPPSKSSYIALFESICQRTCDLVVNWMRVGFVHGVLNTDNMSIIGETIDYGPYGWIDNFDLGWTPNTTDAQGKRYAFGQQGSISQWNLFQLANALYPLVEEVEPFEQALNDYAESYQRAWSQMMRQKLGLTRLSDPESQADIALFTELETLLMLNETDMTIFYRQLAELNLTPSSDPLSWIKQLSPAYYQVDRLSEAYRQRLSRWLNLYSQRSQQTGLISPKQRRQSMNAVNPKYVLRNYLTQQAIDQAEQGDYQAIQTLLEIMRSPYDDQTQNEQYAVKRPEWARDRAGCSMLSCSS